MKYKFIALGVLLFLVIVTFVTTLLIKKTSVKTPPQKPIEEVATTTPETVVKGVHFGEVFQKGEISITPIELIGDSRCANGVLCVYAGHVSIKILVKEKGVSSEHIIESTRPLVLNTHIISLQAVYPYPERTGQISRASYQFEFDVNVKDENISTTKKCFVGGCSGQICSDEEGIVSTCEWRESYACYAGATCERQSNGKCGWTETNTLRMCLENAN